MGDADDHPEPARRLPSADPARGADLARLAGDRHRRVDLFLRPRAADPDAVRGRRGEPRGDALRPRLAVGAGRHDRRHHQRADLDHHPDDRGRADRGLDPRRRGADAGVLRAAGDVAGLFPRRGDGDLRRRLAGDRHELGHQRDHRRGADGRGRGAGAAAADGGGRGAVGGLFRRQDVAAFGYHQPRPGDGGHRSLHPHPAHDPDHRRVDHHLAGALSLDRHGLCRQRGRARPDRPASSRR
jgi:hypothetical protein